MALLMLLDMLCKLCGHDADYHTMGDPVSCGRCPDGRCQDGPDGWALRADACTCIDANLPAARDCPVCRDPAPPYPRGGDPVRRHEHAKQRRRARFSRALDDLLADVATGPDRNRPSTHQPRTVGRPASTHHGV